MSNKVMHTYSDHLITRQNRAEKEFLAAFEAEKPTLENAHVLVNPYFINPLCALILFKSEKPASATMTLHGKRNARILSYRHISIITRARKKFNSSSHSS